MLNVHRLLLAQKPLTKTRTQGHKNHPISTVLRLPLTSSGHVDYSWLRNSWQKLSPCCSENHPRKPVLRMTMKFSTCIDYCLLRPLPKTRTHEHKNHPINPVLQLPLTSSAHIDYHWLINSWQKLSPCCSENHPRKPVLRMTMKFSTCIDYCLLRNRCRKLGATHTKIIQ